MATVTYLKTVSDGNVKTILQRIATRLNKNITVHSGDRNHVPRGGSTRSLHLQHRAADLHIQGLSDANGFAMLKTHMNEIFDATEAYEVIHHGKYTETEAEHLHIGRYAGGRRGYVDFKLEGEIPSTRGNYRTTRENFRTPKSGKLPVPVASGVTVDASILSPNVGVHKSVGIGGDNQHNDVFLVQSLLNKARVRLKEAGVYFQHFNRLAEDGDCGRFTKEAITIFQRDVVGMKEPDGRVDPGGKTIRALYVAAYSPANKIAPRVNRVNTHAKPPANNGEWNGVLAWGAHPRVDAAFRDKTVRICRELGIRNPSWLMAVMAFETGETFSPSVKNGMGSSGTGLIQFMKTTIDGRTSGGKFYPGLGAKLGITHAQLAGMTAVRQLDVVKAYFEQFGTKAAQSNNVSDLYFLVLNPRGFGKSDDYALFTRGTKEYEQNRIDPNNDGKVTVAEVSRVVRDKLIIGLDRYPYKMN